MSHWISILELNYQNLWRWSIPTQLISCLSVWSQPGYFHMSLVNRQYLDLASLQQHLRMSGHNQHFQIPFLSQGLKCTVLISSPREAWERLTQTLFLSHNILFLSLLPVLFKNESWREGWGYGDKNGKDGRIR